MSTESRDKSNLELLPWYSLPRIMVLHKTVGHQNLGEFGNNEHGWYFFSSSDKEPIYLWVPQSGLFLILTIYLAVTIQ